MGAGADKTGPQDPPVFAIWRRELDGRTVVISIEGELDLSTARRLERMLRDARAAGHQPLIVDLSLCKFIDSTALRVLNDVNRSLDHARLVIVTEQVNVLRILELSGMDGAFAIFPTLEGALEHGGEAAAEAS
jgi:stage II sporulation protein AA (anti-sigma F factor antagonist)